MRSTPEKYKIDNKRMRVEAMTEKGEVSFAEECKRLLDLYESNSICDLIVLWPHVLHVSYRPWYQFHHKYPVNSYILRQSLLLPSMSWLQHAYEYCQSSLFQECYGFSNKWLSIFSGQH